MRKKPNLVLITPNAGLLCQLMHPEELRLLQCCCVGRMNCRQLLPALLMKVRNCLPLAQMVFGGQLSPAEVEVPRERTPPWWGELVLDLLILVMKALGAWPSGSHRGKQPRRARDCLEKLQEPPAGDSSWLCIIANAWPNQRDGDHKGPASIGASFGGLSQCMGEEAEKRLL